jgi:hypothetical protein
VLRLFAQQAWEIKVNFLDKVDWNRDRIRYDLDRLAVDPGVQLRGCECRPQRFMPLNDLIQTPLKPVSIKNALDAYRTRDI